MRQRPPRTSPRQLHLLPPQLLLQPASGRLLKRRRKWRLNRYEALSSYRVCGLQQLVYAKGAGKREASKVAPKPVLLYVSSYSARVLLYVSSYYICVLLLQVPKPVSVAHEGSSDFDISDADIEVLSLLALLVQKYKY